MQESPKKLEHGPGCLWGATLRTRNRDGTLVGYRCNEGGDHALGDRVSEKTANGDCRSGPGSNEGRISLGEDTQPCGFDAALAGQWNRCCGRDQEATAHAKYRGKPRVRSRHQQ